MAHGLHAALVAGNSRQVAAPGPTAIAIHDDGDMFWELAGIQSAEEFSFLMIQPGGNSQSQTLPLKKYKLAQQPSLRNRLLCTTKCCPLPTQFLGRGRDGRANCGYAVAGQFA